MSLWTFTIKNNEQIIPKELFIILLCTPYGWIKGVAVIDLEQGNNLSRTIMVDRSHTSCELYMCH